MKSTIKLLAFTSAACITLSACGNREGANRDSTTMGDSSTAMMADPAQRMRDSALADSTRRADSVRLDSARRADSARTDTSGGRRPPGAR